MEPIPSANIKKAFAWNLIEQISFKVVQFIIQLVLTRLLIPADYGLMALCLVFVTFGEILAKAGFGSALIYKDDLRQKVISSVFWTSLAISLILYILLYIFAPVIANFYSDKRIINILRLLGIGFILSGCNAVQVALVHKNLQFQKSFTGNISGIVVSAILGIYAAYKGFGVWALVIQFISNRLITTISFYVINKWIPTLEYSWISIKSLFSYSWKLMATSMLSSLSADIYSLVIGKEYSKSQLGLYDVGNRIPSNIGYAVASTIGSVMFPVFSKIKGTKSQMRTYLKKTNQVSTFLLFPILYGFASMAEPIVRIIFTEKWLAAVPFLQIMCFLYSMAPIHQVNLQIAKSVGRTDLSLYMEAAKKFCDILFLIITIKLGLIWVALGLAGSNFIALWINIQPIKKYIDYSTIQQLKDIFPSWGVSVLSATLAYVPSLFYGSNPAILLAIQILLFITIFPILSFLLNRKCIDLVSNEIKLFPKKTS